MPRIEYFPPSFDLDRGDGSPTIDVCSDCAARFFEGGPMPDLDGVPGSDGATVGSTDCGHPDYDEYGYLCARCNKVLDEHDDA